MNAQFIPGQPPPNNNPAAGPAMMPPLNNGTNNNMYMNPNMNAPPSSNFAQQQQQPIGIMNQKMQSMNLGGMPPQPNGQFSNGPTQHQFPPGQMPQKQFPTSQFPPKQLPPGQQQQQPFYGNMSSGNQPPMSSQQSMASQQPTHPPGPPMSNSQNPNLSSNSEFNSHPPGANLPPPQRPSPNFGSPQLPPMSIPQDNSAASQALPNSFGPPPTSQGLQQQRPAPQGSFPLGQMPPAPQNQPPPFSNQQPQANYPSQMMSPPKPGMPPMPGAQQMPPMPSAHQMPPLSGGQQMPPLPGGQQMPPLPSGQQMSGQQMGSMPHPGIPPMPNNQQYQNKSQMPGMAPPPPTSGYQQPPGGYPPQQQQPPAAGYPTQPAGFAGQQMPYPGQQPSYVGQQAAYPNQPNQPGYPGQQNQYGCQTQTANKLNPNHMPSPIQLMVDDQNANGGVFATNAKGRVPPLVTTDFTVVDQGNASPRYIRSSMYSVPATPDMMKNTAVPFCIVLSPMAETKAEERPPPLLDFSVLTGIPGTGPVRCSRCKAYMCPAMKFVDAGRHFQCAFCKATTEVPMEYTQYLNNGQHYGQSTPEMSLGCYEVVATKEYCRNNVLPTPPALIFVVDVSYNAIRSGLVNLVVGQLRSLLASLPIPPRVGLITYSSTIHFYNINKNLGQPQMMVVGDIQDVFVPLAHGLLAEPGQADHLLDALAQQIPIMFQETKETETILLPAVQAGLEALKASECCGKLLIFHSSLPSAQAPGQLTNRDDRKLLGTEKERTILNPQTKAYNEVAQECVGAGCGIEMFLFNSSYADVATLGQLSRLTGGSLHKYTYFQADVDGDRFIEDLSRVLSRPTAYDAVMRVRTSTGVRATDFYGHFFMSNTTDVELATLDCDKAIAVEIKHDDKLTGEDGVYIQVALLYTHATGQRRLRICNLALGIATQMADLYRLCDLDTIMNFLTKQAVTRLSEHSPKSIRDGVIARCAQSLACYRKHCASPSSVGQLVLPESMKLLPLYANCLLRSDALSGGPDMSCDDRSWAMQAALCADVSTSVVMLYPRLLCLNPLASGLTAEPLRCTNDKLRDDSIFLFENGVHMMLWIGLQTPVDVIKGLFGVNSAAEINTEETHLPAIDNEFNEKVRELIQSIRRERRRAMRLTMVRQHDKLEMIFRHFLVEDDGRNGASSYMDFLCHMHKEIRGLL